MSMLSRVGQLPGIIGGGAKNIVNAGAETLGLPKLFPDNPQGTPYTPAPLPEEDPELIKKADELKAQREKLLNQMTSSENEYKGLMLKSTGDVGSAIDKQLGEMISNAGLTTGLSNQALGANMARQGMQRSGMMNQAVQSNMLKQNQMIGAARQAAEQQKYGYAEVATQAQKDINDRRQQIQQQLLDAELKGITSQRYQEEVQGIQNQYKTFLDGLKLSAQKKQDLYSMLGSLGSIAGLGTGYMAGSPAATSNKETYSDTMAPYQNNNLQGTGMGNNTGGYNTGSQFA